MEVTGRQFQDLTNAPQTRRREALRNLKQGTSGSALTIKRGFGTAESIRVQSYLQQSADSLCSNCTQQSTDSKQRHSRRQHRRRVAQIVAEQWKWFTKHQKAVAVASRHHKHRLLLSATLALQKHAKHQQLEWRRAAIFNHRRQYMLQGKCLLLWQAQLNNSKKLQQRLAKASAARHKTQQQQSLNCWKQYIAYKQRRRKADLQAKYYKSFVLLSSALQQWKVAAQALRQKRLRNQSAVAVCSTRQLSTAFQAWLLGIEIRQQAQQAQQQAKEHHRGSILPRIMKHWQHAVRLLHEARTEGSAAMQVQ